MAPPTDEVVSILEHCRISPPPSAVPDKSLPLTFFDIEWVYFPPVHSILFYEFPHSKAQFNQTVLNLKQSLSLALKYFFPLAGNLILFPSNPTTKPQIRYLNSDSVSLTFAECSTDFNCLSDRIPRNVDKFFPLYPQLPPRAHDASNSSVASPLLALQVTYFPNRGISIGVTSDHVVTDASSIVAFFKAWASITKHGSDGPYLAGGSLPFYDRNVIKDPQGLFELYWSRKWPMIQDPPVFQTRHPSSTPSNIVRASFVMVRAEIERLKKLTKLANVSSFVVVCAYVWSCLAKLRAATGDEEIHEDEVEHFLSVAECRARLDPPIPATYFGNCMVPCVATTKSIQLIGEEGFQTGAEVIAKAIRDRVNNKEGVLKGAEMWHPELQEKFQQRMFGVVGSPKFSFDDIDFGWGIPKNFEVGSIDDTGAMTINNLDGDLEIKLSFPKHKFDAFASIFAKGPKINEPVMGANWLG